MGEVVKRGSGQVTKRLEEVELENVRIIYRNFEGKAKLYNNEGDRNFHVVLPKDVGEKMLALGWNVKVKPPKEEGEEPFYHLKVKVNFDSFRPPRIFQITLSTNSRNPIEADTAVLMDWAEFDSVDLKLSPSRWDVNGKSGYSAYLKILYGVLHEEELDKKYAGFQLEGTPAPAEEQLAIEAPKDDNFIEGEVVSETWEDEDYEWENRQAQAIMDGKG